MHLNSGDNENGVPKNGVDIEFFSPAMNYASGETQLLL